MKRREREGERRGVARENVSWPRSRVTTLRTAAPRPARFPSWRRKDPPRISVPHYYSMCRSRRRGPSSRIRPSVQTTGEYERCACVPAPCRVVRATGARATPDSRQNSLFSLPPLPIFLSLSHSRFFRLFLVSFVSPFCFYSRPCSTRMPGCVSARSSSSHASPQRSMSTRCYASAQPAVTPSASMRGRESDRSYTRAGGDPR